MKKDKELSIWFHFFSFIFKPKKEKISKSFIKKILGLLLLFCLGFVLRITTSFVTPYFVEVSLSEKFSIDKETLYSIFLTCLLAPLIEELAFRLPLVFSKTNLSISFAILSFFMINKFFDLDDHYDLENHFILRVALSCCFGFLIWTIINRYSMSINKFYRDKLGIIVYSYILLFAFMHVANYEEGVNSLLVSIFIMLPHFISGLILSFVRLNYGFSYSLFLHILNNVIPFLILYFII